MGWELASDVVLVTSEHEEELGQEEEEPVSTLTDVPTAFQDLEQLQVITIHGRDKRGRRIVRIVGKFLPARVTDTERLKRYAVAKLAQFDREMFAIVYFHTCVQSDENSPGVTALRQIYDALPAAVKESLEVVYFVHPGIRSRLLLATFGRLFLSHRLYWKLQYVSRTEFLWDYMKNDQLQVPEFVKEHDEELENNPLVDYGVCVDPLQADMKAQGMRFPSTSRAFL